LGPLAAGIGENVGSTSAIVAVDHRVGCAHEQIRTRCGNRETEHIGCCAVTGRELLRLGENAIGCAEDVDRALM
jgi:hypothetical protein